MSDQLAAELRAFGLAVRMRRQRAGFSQEDLAERAKLHRTYVGAIERGERNITLKNILALAHALDTTPVNLLADAQEITHSTNDSPESAQ